MRHHGVQFFLIRVVSIVLDVLVVLRGQELNSEVFLWNINQCLLLPVYFSNGLLLDMLVSLLQYTDLPVDHFAISYLLVWRPR